MIRQESWKISTSMQRRIDTFTLVFEYRYKSWKVPLCAVEHRPYRNSTVQFFHSLLVQQCRKKNSNILSRKKHIGATLLWGFNYPRANLVIFAVESAFVWNVTQCTSAVVAAAAEVFVADFRQQLLSLPLLLASTPHNNSFKTEPISITFAQPPKGRAKRFFLLQ